MLRQTISFPKWIHEVVLYLVAAAVFTHHTNSRPVRRAPTLAAAVFTNHTNSRPVFTNHTNSRPVRRALTLAAAVFTQTAGL